ncbi:MAG: sterol desaturase family protein [Alphaproteobacteria bacterium]|nr:sterol desaturase family protein [Alphaproteobacteria bacterium]
MAAYEISPFQWSMSDWRVWVAAFILMEFTYYWQHRFSHTVRWMWATHAVHHSPNEFVLPAAFRLGWTGAISGSWLIHLPVALLGFHPAMMGAILLVGLRYQFFLHTEKIGRLGPIDWLFNTPSNHRVHHSSEADFLDKNYGNVLMVFDHMFGSYAAERPGQTHRYGLTDPFTSNNPLHIVSREWVRLIQDVIASRTPASAFKAAFGRPSPTPAKPPRASLQLDREVDRHVV